MSLLGLAALGFGAQFQLELMSKRDSVRVPRRVDGLLPFSR
jgi:hypothetical protein